MQLVPLTEYTFDQLRIGLTLDGPCVMPDGTFALLVSLRGKDGGAMPSPSELHWSRDVPDKMRTAPSHLFLRREGAEASAVYLGQIAFVKTGRPARDGYRILFRLTEALPEPPWRELVAENDLVVKDGKLVFYVENQGVCEWAIELGVDDPPVLVRSNAPSDPWLQDAPTLSGFLIQAVLFETVLCAAPFSASSDGADAAALRKLKRHAKPIALPPWADKTEFLAANGLIGFVVPDADVFRIELAAHERAAFEAIEALVADWPNVGF